MSSPFKVIRDRKPPLKAYFRCKARTLSGKRCRKAREMKGDYCGQHRVILSREEEEPTQAGLYQA